MFAVIVWHTARERECVLLKCSNGWKDVAEQKSPPIAEGKLSAPTLENVGWSFELVCNNNNNNNQPHNNTSLKAMSEPAELSVEDQKKADAELKAKEAIEQAALPYKWTQTIKDVDVTVPLPPGNFKSRDLDIVLKKTEIKVAVKGSSAIIEVISNCYLCEKG